MPVNYITLSRQQLYDLVWSKPMSSLAKEFGITDSGLAKRCRAVDVPIPYRGYWTRKAAGRDPPRLPFPKYRRAEPAPPLAGATEASVTRGDKKPVHEGQEPTFQFEARVRKSDTAIPAPSAAREELDVRLRKSPVTVRGDLRGAHAGIRRTALHLKASNVKDFDGRHADRIGPVVNVVVAAASTQRALRIADGVLRAAEAMGWPFGPLPKERDPYRQRYQHNEYRGPIWGCILVEQEPVQITMTERQKQVPHVITQYERESRARGYEPRLPPWDLAYTGDLRLNLASPDGRPFKTFADKAKRRLQEQLSEVMHVMLQRALDEKQWRERRRLEQEAERERQRLAQLAQVRRDAHSKLIAELERQAGAWYRAQFLRSYTRAARRNIGRRRVQAVLQQKTVDFLEWASGYVDQLDPLSTTPLNPDQTAQRSRYGEEEAALKGTLLRLFSHDLQPARKLLLEINAEATTGREVQDDDDAAAESD